MLRQNFIVACLTFISICSCSKNEHKKPVEKISLTVTAKTVSVAAIGASSSVNNLGASYVNSNGVEKFINAISEDDANDVNATFKFTNTDLFADNSQTSSHNNDAVAFTHPNSNTLKMTLKNISTITISP